MKRRRPPSSSEPLGELTVWVLLTALVLYVATWCASAGGWLDQVSEALPWR